MSATASIPAGVTKELRALLPAWAACTAVVAIGGLTGGPQLIGVAMLTYVLGAVALGAQSMGQEYSHRTLGLLLSQPADRRRLFLTKTGVLAALLLILAVVAWATLLEGIETHRLLPVSAPPAILVVVLFALFVAPCMTMTCRNPLAAVVFTLTIAGVLLFGGELLGIAMFGFQDGAG